MFIITQTTQEGRMAAASRPVVHPTLDLARQEAGRLARENPTVKYHVFEGVQTVEVVATYAEKVENHRKEIPF